MPTTHVQHQNKGRPDRANSRKAIETFLDASDLEVDNMLSGSGKQPKGD